MNATNKKYVVTEDVHCSFKRVGIDVPPEILTGCRRKLYDSLPLMTGSETLVISEEEFSRRLNELVEKARASGHFIVSMTHYTETPDAELSVTRVARVIKKSHGVDHEKFKEVVARPGCPSLAEQVERIADESRGRDIVLVDDGLWHGDTTTTVIDCFRGHNKRVAEIVVGLIADARTLCQEIADMTRSVRKFPCPHDGEVKDWLCERDFFIGVPGFGRTLAATDPGCLHADPRGIGIPYCLPYGNPEEWASIKRDMVRDFSRLCVDISIQLFEGLGRSPGQRIRVRDLKTIPYGMENDLNAVLIERLTEWRNQI